ncbi:MAG: TetR/AcrR family transcriptional regulator [Clostridium sp.]|nr:TetR/AcrR family transcriptional regulator [Clostridium sp.]
MKKIILKVAAEKIQLYGLRKFTMDEIAEELKISKKTIYKYFSGKSEIIHEYFIGIVESDIESTEEALKKSNSLVDKLNAIIYSYHKYRLPKHVFDEAYKFYNKEWQEVQKLKDYKLKLIKDILKEAVDKGSLKKDIDLDIVALMLENTVNALFSYEFLSKSNMNLQEATGKAVSIVLYGIIDTHEKKMT